MRRIALVLAVFAVLLGASWAQAAVTTSFGDTQNYWPGWTCKSSPYSSGSYSNDGINGMDHLGVPDLFGGTAGMAVISANTSQLLSITLSYDSSVEGASVAGLLKYGDLFIDANSDGKWDYVVRGNVAGTGYYNTSGTLPINYFHDGISAAAPAGYTGGSATVGPYLMSNGSTPRGGTSWSGYVIRYDHPWALTDGAWNSGTSVGSAGFSGWEDNMGPEAGTADGVTTYSFGSDSPIVLPTNSAGYFNFTIGFCPQCANDVLFEHISVANPNIPPTVPEPATIVVWALLGAAGCLSGVMRRRAR